MFGFKSFASRTEFEFQPGISAVVGPNGSGKSNIMDGICWVLGEQSAKLLRGSKMQDVIFAGSSGRRALGLAEVSITLDNTDQAIPLEYSEIRVTRRVTRSGEGEYLINQVPCRLKDIQEMFWDSGIGKEAYSMIGQGRIDEIISAKPELRRGLIEEAAGVTKYKNRKKEALRKLEETQQHLTRIGDILHEVNSQLQPLALQAEKARIYKELRSKLCNLEVGLWANQLYALKTELEQAEAQMRDCQLQKQQVEAQLAAKEAEYTGLREQADCLEEQIKGGQQAVADQSAAIDRTEADSAVMHEKDRGIERYREKLNLEIDKLKQKKAQLAEQVAHEAAKLNALEEKIAVQQRAADKMEQVAAELEQALKQKNQMIEQGKADIIQLLNRLAKGRNELHNAQLYRESGEKRKTKLQNEMEALQAAISGLATEITAGQTANTTGQDRIKKIQAQIAEYQARCQAEEAELTASRRQGVTLSNELEGLRAKHTTLKELEASYEGFHQGVKAVLLAQRQQRGIRGINGAVAELMSAPAKYETAIEVAAGSALQYLVAESEAAVQPAIDYLKTKRLGRATFLPLDVIKPATLQPREKAVLAMPGVIGRASDLIAYAEKYRPVMEFLLGRTIVTENFSAAREVARAVGYKLKVVTLDGEIINSGGTMTGGSINKKAAGLLARSREIKGLAKQVSELQQLLQQHTAAAAELSMRHGQTQEALQDAQDALHTLQVKMAGLDKELSQQQAAKQDKEGHLQLLASELAILNGEIAKEAERETQLTTDVAILEAEDRRLQNTIKLEQETLVDMQREVETVNRGLTEEKVKLAAIVEQKAGLYKRINALRENDHELAANLEAKDNEIMTLEKQRKEIWSALADGKAKLEECWRQKAALQNDLEVLQQQKATLRQTCNAQEKALQEIRHHLLGQQDENHKVAMSVSRLELRVQNLEKQLTDNYELTYLEALSYRQETLVESTVNRQVKELKEQVKALGNINPAAIEEYTDLQARHDFLEEQYRDLRAAEASLREIVVEADAMVKERFGLTFNQVNHNFQTVFTELFGGGRAELVLTDPADLLETGIEIKAQPPGKKPQVLSLLSGGEKALTAIALLFAILQYKAIPFCILDEVEASLDEANARRFAQFLQTYGQTTQFIVITHRKETMEVADVLFGVTMEDTGVSKLISVKLEEIEEQTA